MKRLIIILPTYNEEYFDKTDLEKEILEKILRSKDFGNIRFQEVMEGFLLHFQR